MKKRVVSLLATALTLCMVAGCGSATGPASTASTVDPPAASSTAPSSAVVPKPESSSAEPEKAPVPNHQTTQAEAPVVYMTTDISTQGLMAAYEALGRTPAGKVAVKLNTGEAGNNHYLDPNLIKEVVQLVDGTIVECNTAYGGSRANTAMHLQVAEDHGFTAIAEIDIMDAEGDMALPVENGTYFTENLVGANFANYNSVLALSHFKGHEMGGFGGALKNISIGIASSTGKNRIHSAGASDTSMYGGKQDAFLESMAEAAKSVSDSLGKGENILYINVMNHLSIDCDCNGSPAKPTMADIGILASLDPVALDQACVDLVYAAPDGKTLIRRMESLNGMHILEHAEKIGLGSRSYQLVSLDG